jgi:hypothetical protein
MSFLLSSQGEWKCQENIQWASYLLLSVTNIKQRAKAGGLVFLNRARLSLESTPSPDIKLPFQISLFEALSAGSGIQLSPLKAKVCAITPAKEWSRTIFLKYVLALFLLAYMNCTKGFHCDISYILIMYFDQIYFYCSFILSFFLVALEFELSPPPLESCPQPLSLFVLFFLLYWGPLWHS